jgi:hypothetical protein
LVLLFAGLACNLPLGLGGGSEPDAGLPDVESESFTVNAADETLLAPVDLSGAQRQVLAVRGIPNRFMVRFSEELREETWYYDVAGYDITFRNGETYTENQTDPVPVDLVLESDYVPWWFNGAMGLSELLVISGSDAFAVESLEEVFMEEVSLVTLPGLDAGFRGEELLFVRALPMGAAEFQMVMAEDAVEPVEQPGAGSGLTAAELAHEGTHTYNVYCTYSDGLVDEYSDTITWTFTGDAVYYDDIESYPWVDENYYALTDDLGAITIYFKENVITITSEFPEENADGEVVMISGVCAYTQE